MQISNEAYDEMKRKIARLERDLARQEEVAQMERDRFEAYMAAVEPILPKPRMKGVYVG